MNLNLLEVLVCPRTKEKLTLADAEYDNDRVKSGKLVCSEYEYPIINYIPRFVSAENYASNFGFQWNKFAKTQLDSNSGKPISANRFWSSTEWSPDFLKNALVLDCGCGSGRFAEVALKAGCRLVAIDYSSAVDACFENLGKQNNLDVIQADIYHLPFNDNSFDYVYSLGVLQHTPNVLNAFKAAYAKVKSNGFFCVDFYENNFKSKLLPKFWLRPITKRMNQGKLFSLLEKNVPLLMRLSDFFGKVPILGKYLKRIVPVANYRYILDLNETQLNEWALLDTFDWLGPAYDNPQNKNTLKKWGLIIDGVNIEILKVVHLVFRCKKK